MKGLSMSEPMMLAWMAGKKTVTRRLINPQPVHQETKDGFTFVTWEKFDKLTIAAKKTKGTDVEVGDWFSLGCMIPHARYRQGETVYIKEGWRIEAIYRVLHEVSVQYRADGSDVMRKAVPVDFLLRQKPAPKSYHWRSPMMMPEWASRSHARIVSVRPERVQEITEEEAIKEGVLSSDYDKTYRYSFSRLWDNLHPGSWDRNDWVWRIELEKVEVNHD